MLCTGVPLPSQPNHRRHLAAVTTSKEPADFGDIMADDAMPPELRTAKDKANAAEREAVLAAAAAPRTNKPRAAAAPASTPGAAAAGKPAKVGNPFDVAPHPEGYSEEPPLEPLPKMAAVLKGAAGLDEPAPPPSAGGNRLAAALTPSAKGAAPPAIIPPGSSDVPGAFKSGNSAYQHQAWKADNPSGQQRE